MKPVLVYTMTAGLGDIVVLDSLATTIENGISNSICRIFHRRNPHTKLWMNYCSLNRYVNVFSFVEFFRGIKQLRQYRLEGRTVFGLQMAPGSIQGYLFHSFLKKVGALDFIVDFNMINADILTPPRGKYIYNRHLNQENDLLGGTINEKKLKPTLPFCISNTRLREEPTEIVIGIHPWSRRGNLQAFVWEMSNWLAIVRYLLTSYSNVKIVVIGRDEGFAAFRALLKDIAEADRVWFEPSTTVTHLSSTIASLDLLVTVNTGAVHIGHALDVPMIILSGPSLDLWIPEGETIISVTDSTALFQSADRSMDDIRFSKVCNITVENVIASLKQMIPVIASKYAVSGSEVS